MTSEYILDDSNGPLEISYLYIRDADDYVPFHVQHKGHFWTCRELKEYRDKEVEIWWWSVGDRVLINPDYIMMIKECCGRYITRDELHKLRNPEPEDDEEGEEDELQVP